MKAGLRSADHPKVSGDDGGRAPEPSDLGSEWVEALLGDAPRRSTVEEPETPGSPGGSGDAAAAGVPPGPADLGDGDWVEALLASPRREPGISGPVPVAEPVGQPDGGGDLTPPGDASWVDALLDAPGPRAPAEPPTAEQIAEVVEAPAGTAHPPDDEHERIAPVLPLPLADPAPGGEPTPGAARLDLWGEPPASDEGWDGDATTGPTPTGDATAAGDTTGNDVGAAPRAPGRGPGWEAHAVEAPLFSAAPAPAPLELVADPEPGADPVADRGADDGGAPPEAAPAPQGLAPFDLPYAEDDTDDSRPDPGGADIAGAVLAGAGAVGLVRGAIPPRADVPEPGAELAAPKRVLDLRPSAAGPTPPDGRKKKGRSGDGGRRRALIIAGAAAILIVALVGAQLATEQGEDDDGAVITADAASIEAPEDAEERGVSVGIGEVEGASSADDKDDDVDAGDGGGTVQGNDPADSTSDTTASGGGGGQAAPSGTLTISTDRLSLGSGTSGTLQLSNSGGGGLSWSASTSGGGYSVSPGSGSLSPGQAVTLQVGFNQGSLPEGTANGTLRINASGSYSVALAAEVNRPPAISAVGWQSCGATSVLKAHVEDETGEPVTRVEMIGTAPNGSAFRETAVWSGYGNYRAQIGPFSANGAIRYYVQATDSRGNVARSGTVNDTWNNGC